MTAPAVPIDQLVEDLRVEALFASSLQPSEHPSSAKVWETVNAMVLHHGEVWCAGRVAQEFGDHPQAAVERMCWCRKAVEEAFGF